MKAKLMLFAALALPAIAQAQLPSPTPGEAAKKQATAEKKAKDEAAAKESLGRAQNRVAVRYHAAHTLPVKKPAKTEEAEPMPESEATIEE